MSEIKLKNLRDKDGGELFYPYTSEHAVLTEDGETLYNRQHFEENPEFIKVDIDADGRIYSSITPDSKRHEHLPTDFTDELTVKNDKVVTETSFNDVSTAVDNLIPEVASQNKKLNYYNIGIDSERGVLRIGGMLFKMISYEGEFTADDLIDATVFVQSTETVENPEFLKVILDSNEKILWGKYTDGTETNIDLGESTMVDSTTSQTVRVQRIINLIKNN